MIPFQILPWSEIKRFKALPQVCQVTQDDFREFELPISGVWRKIMTSEVTPGLPATKRDKSFPARTHVIGVIDPIAKPQVVYLKSELINQGIVKNEELNSFFFAIGDTVNAFKGSAAGKSVDLILNRDGTLADNNSGTVWDTHGKYKSGLIKSDLEILAITDEYWFAWKAFHPSSQIIRLQ